MNIQKGFSPTPVSNDTQTLTKEKDERCKTGNGIKGGIETGVSSQNERGFSLPIVIGVIVVLGVVGGVVYFNAQPQAEKMVEIGEDMMHDGEAMMEEGEEMMEEGEAMMEEGESMMEGESKEEGEAMTEQSSGTYEEYSPEKLAQAEGDTLIFFHAKWCPTCRSLDSNISRNLNEIPAGLTILKADYDKETKLRQKYGVTTQHTIVQVDAEGNAIGKWFGSPTLSSVINQVQ